MTSRQLSTVRNVVLALCLTPASAWAQGAEAVIGAAFDDALRLLFLFVAGGVGFAVALTAGSSQRRETLALTFLLGLVVALVATFISLHYGSRLNTGPLDQNGNRFVAASVGKFIWSVLTGVIGLMGMIISLVRARGLAPSDP